MDDTNDDEAFEAWSDEATIAEFRRECFERRIEHLKRAWKSGSFAAIGDAIKACNTHGMPPPEWIVGAVVALVRRYEPKIKAKRRFESHNHLERWGRVCELLERTDELRDYYRAEGRSRSLAAENLPPEIDARRRERLLDAEHIETLLAADRITLEDIFEIV